jgi:hypothetical protein
MLTLFRSHPTGPVAYPDMPSVALAVHDLRKGRGLSLTPCRFVWDDGAEEREGYTVYAQAKNADPEFLGTLHAPGASLDDVMAALAATRAKTLAA